MDMVVLSVIIVMEKATLIVKIVAEVEKLMVKLASLVMVGVQ
jgi:hypothetical protein